MVSAAWYSAWPWRVAWLDWHRCNRRSETDPVTTRSGSLIAVETVMCHAPQDLQRFATEFRDGLIGTQPRASRGMCALVSIPLRAALNIFLDVATNLVTEDGHTFLGSIQKTEFKAR